LDTQHWVPAPLFYSLALSRVDSRGFYTPFFRLFHYPYNRPSFPFKALESPYLLLNFIPPFPMMQREFTFLLRQSLQGKSHPSMVVPSKGTFPFAVSFSFRPSGERGFCTPTRSPILLFVWDQPFLFLALPPPSSVFAGPWCRHPLFSQLHLRNPFLDFFFPCSMGLESNVFSTRLTPLARAFSLPQLSFPSQ